jgi:hypothetical protein
MAAEVYPLLENRDGDGDLKTQLVQVDMCLEDRCPCWDFDRVMGVRCFRGDVLVGIGSVSIRLRASGGGCWVVGFEGCGGDCG